MKKLLIVLCFMFMVFMGFNESTVSAADDDYFITVEESLQVFEGENVVFDYVSNNGSIISLSDNLDEDDYIIEDSKIVIKEDFIRNILNETPNRSTFIASYVFQSSDGMNYLIGYLFIDLQSGKELYINHYPTIANPNKYSYMIEMKVSPKDSFLLNDSIKRLEK